MLVFNKDNEKDYWNYRPIDVSLSKCERMEDICQKPKFVDQMDGNLFKKIDGVVDYNFGGGVSGHLLLFNIDGTPKYCFTGEDKDLSDEVSH